MADPTEESKEAKSQQDSDDVLSDLLRGRVRAGVGAATAKEVAVVREAARRSVDRELRGVDAKELERVRSEILKRINSPGRSVLSRLRPRISSRTPQWGFAMAAGISGVVVGILVQSQTSLLPGKEASDELIISVGQVERGAETRQRVAVRVRDPIVASSMLAQALILDHIPFKAYRNTKTGLERLIFDVPGAQAVNVAGVLRQLNAELPTAGGVEMTFERT